MDNKIDSKLYDIIMKNKANNEKMFVLLIDPEKHTESSLRNICKIAQQCRPHFIFVGGSQICNSIDNYISIISQETDIPIILFPSHFSQLSPKIKSMLFTSLTSGRNPKYLIEQQIASAKFVKEHNIEAISTSYILINGGIRSAVESVSETHPYDPVKDYDLITDTAIASELLGFKMIYLEAGSGAATPVSGKIIKAVKDNTSLPVIVGGGLKNTEDIYQALTNGADIIVVGNHLEKYPEHLYEFTNFTKQYNTKP